MTKKIATQDAMSLDIAQFKKLCVSFTPDIAVMVRGKHGIGKSQAVYQVAQLIKDDFYKNPENCAAMVKALGNEPSIKRALDQSGGMWTYDMGLPVVEKRLSQISESEIIGLPKHPKDSQVTEFLPLSWMKHSCTFPVVMFLDELNRATKAVEQATFQLADSKAFDQNQLHPSTRIFVAVNIGSDYNVEEFDPAAISRYAVVNLEPTVKEFLDYARKIANFLLVDFLIDNPTALDYNGTIEPNFKHQDRRAWIRLDQQLTATGLYDQPNNLLFLHMSSTMVGFPCGNLFWDYAKNFKIKISGEDIAKNWINVRHKIPKKDGVYQQLFIELTTRFAEWMNLNIVSKIDQPEVTKNMMLFFNDAPTECLMAFYNSVTSVNHLWVSVEIADKLVKVVTAQE